MFVTTISIVVAGKVLVPFDTSDLSYHGSIPFPAPYYTFKVTPIFLTYPTIYIAGHYLVIFLFVGSEDHINIHLSSFILSGHAWGILAQLRFTHLRHTNRYKCSFPVLFLLLGAEICFNISLQKGKSCLQTNICQIFNVTLSGLKKKM